MLFKLLIILVLILIYFILMMIVAVLASFIEEKEIDPTDYEETELLFFGGEEDW